MSEQELCFMADRIASMIKMLCLLSRVHSKIELNGLLYLCYVRPLPNFDLHFIFREFSLFAYYFKAFTCDSYHLKFD